MLLPLRDSVAVGHSGIRVDLLPMSVGAAQLRRQRRIIRMKSSRFLAEVPVMPLSAKMPAIVQAVLDMILSV